jgi:Rrf2 family transcriptional regulator, cysteine metabolism repressor
MKLSTKGRYGLRCLIDLAVHSKGEQVPLCAIAERQKISENYLEQVFAALRKGGLVKSVKGAQGGYILAQDPAKISVGKILRVLEGSLSIIDTEEGGGEGEAAVIRQALREHLWNAIDKSINKLVDSITLSDLIEEYEKKKSGDITMYFI